MSHYTGHKVRKIKTTSWEKFVKLCVQASDEKFEFHKASSKRNWPFFWQRVYKAKYRRYYIIDEDKIAYIPKSQLDYIKSGTVPQKQAGPFNVRIWSILSKGKK